MDNENRKGSLALKAGIWYVISSVLVKAISVLTTPVFTRIMSTEQYGTVQTFISWQSMLLPFFTMNLPFSIGRAKLDFDGQLDRYSGAMQTLSALVSVALCAVASILLGTVSVLLELSKTETLILMAYLLFTPTVVLFQNKYKYTYRYKQNIAIAWYMVGGSVVLSLLLVWFAPEEHKALMMIVGSTVPNVLLALYFWLKSAREGSLNTERTYWKYGLKISVPLIFHTVCMHMLSQADRIFITKIWGKSETAFYSLAYVFGVALHVVTTAVNEGWLPWFHDTYYAGKTDEIRKNARPIVVLGCYIGLACIALAPEVIYILGDVKYARSVDCVPPIVLGVVCQYIYTHYVNIELHLKKTTYVSAGTIIAALLNIVLNAVFIPMYGFVAAAYTTLASYFALMVVHFVITRRILKVRLYNDLFMFGALAVTAGVSFALMQTYNHSLVRYLLTAAGFASFLFIFRHHITNWIRKRKEKKHRQGEKQ